MTAEPCALDPESQAQFDKAVELSNEGQYDPALKTLESLLERFPTHPKIRVQLGLILGFTGDFDGSLEALKEGVRLDPSDLEARNNLGLTFVMLGMNEEAKAEFETVLCHDPQNPVALKNIAFFR